MLCPICSGSLDEIDGFFICQDVCGSAFSLEYRGMCNPGDADITERGFEPKEFLEKYGKRIRAFEHGDTLNDSNEKVEEGK